jgi:hypothetical protein
LYYGLDAVVGEIVEAHFLEIGGMVSPRLVCVSPQELINNGAEKWVSYNSEFTFWINREVVVV